MVEAEDENAFSIDPSNLENWTYFSNDNQGPGGLKGSLAAAMSFANE